MTSASPDPSHEGRVLSTRPDVLPGGCEPERRAVRTVHLVDTVATSWLLVVCSMVVWSLLPAVWGWQPSLILTGSMRPALKPGDVVLVAPPAPDRPVRRGQVVLVRDPEAPSGRVMHRVVRIDEDAMITTQGDANPNPDVVAHSPDDVLGIARLVVPAAGRIALLRAGGVSGPSDRAWIALTLGAAAVFMGTRLRRGP